MNYTALQTGLTTADSLNDCSRNCFKLESDHVMTYLTTVSLINRTSIPNYGHKSKATIKSMFIHHPFILDFLTNFTIYISYIPHFPPTDVLCSWIYCINSYSFLYNDLLIYCNIVWCVWFWCGSFWFVKCGVWFKFIYRNINMLLVLVLDYPHA